MSNFGCKKNKRNIRVVKRSDDSDDN